MEAEYQQIGTFDTDTGEQTLQSIAIMRSPERFMEVQEFQQEIPINVVPSAMLGVTPASQPMLQDGGADRNASTAATASSTGTLRNAGYERYTRSLTKEGRTLWSLDKSSSAVHTVFADADRPGGRLLPAGSTTTAL